MDTFIKKIREETGWSQEKLGAHLNLSQGEISHYECGRRTPSFNTSLKLFKLAKKLNISANLDSFFTSH